MQVLRINDEVTFLYGPYANAIVLRAGDDVTLVDSGYPRDIDRFVHALEGIGVTQDNVVAGLLTHGHTDHQGGFARLRARGWTFPIFACAEELPNIRRDVVEQITVKSAGLALARPRTARWALGAVRRGGFDDVAITDDLHALPTDGQPLDLPGAPTALWSAGHTSGHVAYSVTNGEVLLSGDALVTGHHTLSGRRPTPQLLPAIFHHCASQAAHSATLLGNRDAPVILPGHGLPFRSSPMV